MRTVRLDETCQCEQRDWLLKPDRSSDFAWFFVLFCFVMTDWSKTVTREALLKIWLPPHTLLSPFETPGWVSLPSPCWSFDVLRPAATCVFPVRMLDSLAQFHFRARNANLDSFLCPARKAKDNTLLLNPSRSSSFLLSEGGKACD